jgi:hypothetical protein
MCESTVLQHVAGFKRVVNNKWARVHIANWVDEAHHSAGTTQVQTWQRLTECVEMEK